MKGIIFNLLQDVVSQHHGEDVWDDLIDAAGSTASILRRAVIPTPI